MRTKSSIMRSVVGVGVSLSMFACATGPDLKAELSSIRQELTAQRRAQEEQRRSADELRLRLEQLETRVADGRSESRKTDGVTVSSDMTNRTVAALPVVKLEPKPEVITLEPQEPPAVLRAPPIDTRVPLREPSTGKSSSVVTAAKPFDEDEASSDHPVDLNAIVEREAPAESDFAAAMEAYNGGHWKKATAGFKKVATRYPKHSLVPVATYWTGRTQQASGKCSDALGTWSRLLKDHPRHDLVSPALFEMAQCETKLGNAEKARAWLQRLVKEHPSATEAGKARTLLADSKVEG